MKILQINSSGFKEGGAETSIVVARTLLEKHGHTVKILTSDARPDLPRFNDYSYTVPTGILATLARLWNFSAYRTLKQILQEFNPDIVHLHTIGHASPSILFALRKYPIVATIHGPEAYTKSLLLWCLSVSDFTNGEYNPRTLRITGKIRYIYMRYICYPFYHFWFKRVDMFVTLSEYMHRIIAAEGIQNEYIRQGITLLEYKPLQHEIGNTLLYAGRLEKYKGIDYLINALPDVLSQFPKTRLLIAGDGTYKKNLEVLAAALGLENKVYFLGHLNRSQLEKVYQESSIVVVPSTWPEAFGLVGIEAMSVGRPIIASNVGGISEWLNDGKSGILVPPQSSKAIADSIQRLLSDPDMLLSMSAESRKRVEEYDPERHVLAMEQIYLKTISRKNKKQ